jgi:hypothetical protein
VLDATGTRQSADGSARRWLLLCWNLPIIPLRRVLTGFLVPPTIPNETQAVDMGVQLTRLSPFVVPFLELGVERSLMGGTVNLEFDDSFLIMTSQGLTGVLGRLQV